MPSVGSSVWQLEGDARQLLVGCALGRGRGGGDVCEGNIPHAAQSLAQVLNRLPTSPVHVDHEGAAECILRWIREEHWVSQEVSLRF